ncbi:ribbon-helix-helix protein, CopG family [Mycolicibacter virginiensis]|nr:ribbon-helix-helix protein, CopG family [Mycolicibacter virginiensis]ULP49210.1 ribbon-helix-helix protein, CopG family [Mycolicibacter virginiensis]
MVQARVPATLHAKLQALADRRHISLSKLLREAIHEFMERKENPA